MIPAGLMVRAEDDKGNALEGSIYVGVDKIGRTLEPLRVSVCTRYVEVRLDKGPRMSRSLELQPQKNTEVIVQFMTEKSRVARHAGPVLLGRSVASEHTMIGANSPSFPHGNEPDGKDSSNAP